jgi:hypothetical protein
MLKCEEEEKSVTPNHQDMVAYKLGAFINKELWSRGQITT